VPIDLYFNLAETLRLAEHAVAATEHSRSGSEHLDGKSCPGALCWVADWGTYLTSSGLPRLSVDPSDPDSANVLVYAEGWGPDSDRRALAYTDVGGDDFDEHLHLTTVDQPGAVPLIDQLRAAAQRGDQYLVLRVARDTVSMLFSRTGPADPAAAEAAPQPAPDARNQTQVTGPAGEFGTGTAAVLEPDHIEAIANALTAAVEGDTDVSTAPAFELIFERAPAGRPKWVELLLLDQRIWRSWDVEHRLPAHVSVLGLLDLLTSTVEGWMPPMRFLAQDAALIGCALTYADPAPPGTGVTRTVVARDIDGRTYHSIRRPDGQGVAIQVEDGAAPAVTGPAVAAVQALQYLLDHRMPGAFRLPSTGYAVVHIVQPDGEQPTEVTTFIDVDAVMDDAAAIAHAQATLAELKRSSPSNIVHTLRLIHRDQNDRTVWTSEPVRGSTAPQA
jgi:hypothetical protein